jgi:hypothetical protein
MLLMVQDGTQKSQKVFMNIPTEVGATEAEAIGEGIVTSCSCPIVTSN